MTQNGSITFEQLLGPSGYASLGFVGVVSNALIVLSIARYNELRIRKEFILLMTLSFADFLNMGAFWLGGIFRLYVIPSGRSHHLYTRSECLCPSIFTIRTRWHLPMICARV